MKKRSVRGTLIGLIVCMIMVMSPAGAEMATGTGTVSAATNGSANALVEHAVKHNGCRYNNFGDAKAFKTDWCAAFVQHCSAKTGAGKIIPTGGYNYVNDLSYNIVNSKGGKITFVNNKFYNAKYKAFSSTARSQGRVVKNISYKPRKGDLIIFSSDGSYWWTHVGIVRADASSPLKNVPTIEGNTGSSNFRTSRVMQKSRTSVGGFYIVAYVTPKYAPNKFTHTITFNTNGGNGSYATLKVQDGNAFTIPTVKPTRTGYTFKNWFAKRLTDQTWHAYSRGWLPWNDITKYKYEPSRYAPGAKHNMDISWMRNCPKSNYTFYAQWEANKFTVQYNANGGEGTMPNSTHTYGTLKKLTKNTFVREGYIFKGWNVYDARQNKWMYTNGGIKNWYKAGAAPAGNVLCVYPDMTEIAWTTAESNGIIIMNAVWEEDPNYINIEDTYEDIQDEEVEDEDIEEEDMEGEGIEDVDIQNDDTDDDIVPEEDNGDEVPLDPVYEWTDWSAYSTVKPVANDNRQIESITEFRYRDKQVVKSGRDSLSGYTKESTQTDNPVYGSWSTSAKSGSTSVTDAKKSVITVESKSVQKSLAHYCSCRRVCWRNGGGKCRYCGGKTNYGVISIYSSKSLAQSGFKKDSDGAYFLPTTIRASNLGRLGTIYYMTWQGKYTDSFTTGSRVGGKNTYVWHAGTFTISRTKTVNSVNTFSKWGSWSSWSTTQYANNNNRQVESRTLYRYRDYEKQL